MKFQILYKNGKYTEIVQESTQLEIVQFVAEVYENLTQLSPGVLKFGNLSGRLRIIRVMDISQINIQIEEADYGVEVIN